MVGDLTKRRPDRLRAGCIALALFLAVLVTTSNKNSHAAGEVDMALLLALDVSASVDGNEFHLMREGLALALTSPAVARAVLRGPHRAIAISVVQWSGFQEQETKITWRRVTSEADLERLAHRVRQMKRRYKGGATDIGGALQFARSEMRRLPFAARRLVIDIAGDGRNNVNFAPMFERDKTVKQGITINGLAVVGDTETLVDYFARQIIGGPGAFVENTPDFDGFAKAMQRKLVREIGSPLMF